MKQSRFHSINDFHSQHVAPRIAVRRQKAATILRYGESSQVMKEGFNDRVDDMIEGEKDNMVFEFNHPTLLSILMEELCVSWKNP